MSLQINKAILYWNELNLYYIGDNCCHMFAAFEGIIHLLCTCAFQGVRNVSFSEKIFMILTEFATNLFQNLHVIKNKSKLFTVSNIKHYHLLERFRLAEKSFTIKTGLMFMEFHCRLFLLLHSELMCPSIIIFKKRNIESYFYPMLYNALKMYKTYVIRSFETLERCLTRLWI